MSSAAEYLPTSRSLKALEREAELAAFVADLEAIATALQGSAR